MAALLKGTLMFSPENSFSCTKSKFFIEISVFIYLKVC